MKKKIPIGLRKILDQEANDKNRLFRIEFGESPLIRFVDLDESSDFYFEIVKVIPASGNNKVLYRLKFLPYNEETLSPIETNVDLSNFRQNFTKWKNLLIEANKDSPFFDDEFEKTYFEEIEPQFKIIEEDAEIKPFSIEQQKMITAFLNKAEKTIKQSKDQTEDSKSTIEFIEKTKAEITKSTKKQVIKNIKTIIAKGFKIGLKVGEKLLVEFTAELAKKLLIGP